jgi:GNAT superfamily N-acetyltransferase
MTVIVRPALLNDVPRIVDFNCRLAQETENLTLNPTIVATGVDAILKDPLKGRYFVAVSQGTVIGQLSITTEWSDWRNGWLWWIQSVYIVADWRRRGVFRLLYEHLAKTAQDDASVIGLRLYVEEHNHAAQATYAAMGMKRIPFQIYQRSPL